MGETKARQAESAEAFVTLAKAAGEPCTLVPMWGPHVMLRRGGFRSLVPAFDYRYQTPDRDASGTPTGGLVTWREVMPLGEDGALDATGTVYDQLKEAVGVRILFVRDIA